MQHRRQSERRRLGEASIRVTIEPGEDGESKVEIDFFPFRLTFLVDLHEAAELDWAGLNRLAPQEWHDIVHNSTVFAGDVTMLNFSGNKTVSLRLDPGTKEGDLPPAAQDAVYAALGYKH
jgi:hypothetical protein